MPPAGIMPSEMPDANGQKLIRDQASGAVPVVRVLGLGWILIPYSFQVCVGGEWGGGGGLSLNHLNLIRCL